MRQERRPQQELMDAILEQAAQSKEFRTGLLRDARSAIYRRFGIQIPESFNIKFIERSAELDALVVLPPLTSADEELTDSDLEIVVGGTGGGRGQGGPDAHPLSDLRGLNYRW